MIHIVVSVIVHNFVMQNITFVYAILCQLHGKKIRPKLVSLIGVDVPDESLIRFMFPVSRYDTEVVWLLGNYLAEIWNLVHIRGDFKVKCEELFGFLKFKYKQDQQGARVHMNIIIDIV